MKFLSRLFSKKSKSPESSVEANKQSTVTVHPTIPSESEISRAESKVGGGGVVSPTTALSPVNDSPDVLVADKPNDDSSKGNSMQDTIAQIHEAFDTEVDKLLELANIKRPIDDKVIEKLDKADRLRYIGFENSKDVTKALEDEKQAKIIEIENAKKNELIDAINYFSVKYPVYKMITLESVKKICVKYGLIYGGTDKYIGTVPEKNIQDIENMKIKIEDMCYQKFKPSAWKRPVVSYISFDDFSTTYEKNNKEKDFSKDRLQELQSYQFSDSSGTNTYAKCKMMIVAPKKDFDTNRMEVVDYQLLDIEDPIVLQPVLFRNQRYFLVVTK